MMLLNDLSKVAKSLPPPEESDSLASSLPLTVEDIFHTHAPRVYSVARRMLGHEADAEDVTQDVLLQVIRKLDSFRGEASLTTWLYRVTVNAALLHRRKHARRRKQQVDAQLDSLPDRLGMGRNRRPYRDPHQHVLDKELQETIEKAIAGLPVIYRDVYVLADVEGMSNGTIGKLLNLRVQAVKSRLHRARLMMREVLASYTAA
jgi:RNA polymerase sigma-70 factor (ECF subfamily)